MKTRLRLVLQAQFLSDLPEIWKVGHTCDNKAQVPWLITAEVVNAHVRQFTSGLAQLYACAHDSAPIYPPILIKFGT